MRRRKLWEGCGCEEEEVVDVRRRKLREGCGCEEEEVVGGLWM